MATTDLKSLIGKLNKTCHNALESAGGLAVSYTHYQVDIEHLLRKLLEGDNTDIHRILHHYGVDTSHLQRDLTVTLEGFKTGSTRIPRLSPDILMLFEKAWVLASVDCATDRVRSGHLLLTLLDDAQLARLIRETSRDLSRIPVEELKHNLSALTASSGEESEAQRVETREAALPTGRAGKTPALDQFTINLTQRAQHGLIDPVLGREAEIRQMVDILMRRRQNNPILTGEAGVGKTAVVEGLARRIADADVPPPLRNVVLRTLDLGLLQAGASVKGEFEKRLKAVIEEVKSSPSPIIVFIDEAHTLIGAGGAAGQSDAANLLKPALARGELRTIAATTWSEYKRYFEKDAALARRFQVIKVEEPTEEQAVVMMRGLKDTLEEHHKVRIFDAAIVDAVRLSRRYLSGRQLPDKAVSVLDTACARVAISQSAIPAPIEDSRRHLDNLRTEIRVLTRETAGGADHSERLAELEKTRESSESELAALEQRWQSEKELVGGIHTLLAQLENGGQPNNAANDTQLPAREEEKTAIPDKETLRGELAERNQALVALQGETPLLQIHVTGQTIADVISGWTGIPVGKMLKDEIKTVQNLGAQLQERVLGQSPALEMIARRIHTSRAGLEDPGKPAGVFLLVGPSGVGKTETALALADTLYGGERNIVTINMSEYQEAHTVSGLKGSPPGYVGYGEGGVLTEAVRRKPYTLVLLDEIEKAHPDVLELFYQVFDKGVLDDAEGREIDFKNTVIILTSNAGTDTIMRACPDAEPPPDPKRLADKLRRELQRIFKPAFLGRLIVVPYYPIRDETLRRIVALKLNRIKTRFRINHRAKMVYGEELVGAIADRCTEVESGARNIDHILTGTVLPEMASEVLAHIGEGQPISRVEVSVDDSGELRYEVS